MRSGTERTTGRSLEKRNEIRQRRIRGCRPRIRHVVEQARERHRRQALGGEQQPDCLADPRRTSPIAEAPKPDNIGPNNAGAIAGHEGPGGYIATDKSSSSHHGSAPNPNKLVDGAPGRQNCTGVDPDVPTHLRAVGKHDVITNLGVMTDVGIGHDHHARAEPGGSRPHRRTPVNGGALADLDIGAEFEATVPPESVLGRTPEQGTGVNVQAGARPERALEHRSRPDPSRRLEQDLATDARQGVDLQVWPPAVHSAPAIVQN